MTSTSTLDESLTMGQLRSLIDAKVQNGTFNPNAKVYVEIVPRLGDSRQINQVSAVYLLADESCPISRLVIRAVEPI